MSGGAAPGARELDETPTWAVSLVCAIIVMLSIFLEKLLHAVGKWFEKRHKYALNEALEKIKGELMILGFISLSLTFSQNYVSKVCIPVRYANTMLPCLRQDDEESSHHVEHHRRFLSSAEGESTAECSTGHVPLISMNGLHQLHIFIFFLAVFHVIYSATTMMLGRMKIREWKEWEKQCLRDDDAMNDGSRFRLTHETSFVKDHNNYWTNNPLFFYFVCFFRQFFRSVRRADYLSMRHGFISVHLAPGTKFNFQKYIKRSLEDDFKRVVGISPLLWASVVLFLLFNVQGWQTMLWVSIIPVVVVLAVGTKLQAIITEMALEIQQRHAVVQGIPVVEVSDRHFWFSWPELVLYLIHFVLFQNAFEITYFFWIWYEFGLNSCFHRNGFVVFRVSLGFGAQFLCSYITLPLYALVTQMGSTMKKTIFDEQTSKALMHWHKKAMKKAGSGKMQPQRTRTLGRTNSEEYDRFPTPSMSAPVHHDQDGDFSDVELEPRNPNPNHPNSLI